MPPPRHLTSNSARPTKSATAPSALQRPVTARRSARAAVGAAMALPCPLTAPGRALTIGATGPAQMSSGLVLEDTSPEGLCDDLRQLLLERVFLRPHHLNGKVFDDRDGGVLRTVVG